MELKEDSKTCNQQKAGSHPSLPRCRFYRFSGAVYLPSRPFTCKNMYAIYIKTYRCMPVSLPVCYMKTFRYCCLHQAFPLVPSAIALFQELSCNLRCRSSKSLGFIRCRSCSRSIKGSCGLREKTEQMSPVTCTNRRGRLVYMTNFSCYCAIISS